MTQTHTIEYSLAMAACKEEIMAAADVQTTPPSIAATFQLAALHMTGGANSVMM